MPQRRDALFRHFPALRHADYRALWFAAAASAVSLWAMIMARAWLALELSGSGFWVGAVTFAALAPWALSPLGGALADRFDRARVVMLSRTITASLALGLALLVFTDVITVWQIALFAGAAGLARAVETPAQQALLPNTIDSSALLNAIALVSLTQFGSRLIGPLAGLPLLTGVGPGWVFVMSAGFLLLSISQLARLRVRSVAACTARSAPSCVRCRPTSGKASATWASTAPCASSSASSRSTACSPCPSMPSSPSWRRESWAAAPASSGAW